ncbi:hypothetical protein L1987_08454 [Smallanthus sonchifolius]|uniref:Uncharacterized protein n=1 Tax=Smallanthus sonchifolius TaxID=185202 RepID=A0ACB9JLT9_9ASTR|nr:hypothetical protein L1987_08454 [Smallanthus sonchifolius]
MGHFARECKAPKANQGAGHQRQAYQSQPRQQQQQQTPPAQTAACANVGTAEFDWSFQYEDVPVSNQALMADTAEIPPQVFEHLCSQACIDKVLGYRKHNQNLIDQNEEFLQMKSEFKKVEITYKEKIECLKKEISSLKHEQTNLETQIDDLLVKLKSTRADLAEQKVHVEKYEFSSKKLQRLLDIQVHEKVKLGGLGYGKEQYNTVPHPADYVAIYEPSFDVAKLDTANRNLDPSMDEPLVKDCTTSSESELTLSDHDETSTASSEAVLNRVSVPTVLPAVPAPVPFKQIRISYPPGGRKLNTEKGQTSRPTNSKSQFMPNQKNQQQVRRVTTKKTQFRNSSSPPRKQQPKVQQSCIICGESNHFAAKCQKIQAAAKAKSAAERPRSSAATSAADKLKPSAAKPDPANRPKPQAGKSAADRANSSAAKAKSAADKEKRTGKPLLKQWKAKISAPVSKIIIGAVECTHDESECPRTLFFKKESSWTTPTN